MAQGLADWASLNKAFGSTSFDNLNNETGIYNTSTLQPESSNSGLFGLNNNQWSNIGTAGQLGAGLAGTYLGFQQLGLAKDAFKYNKQMQDKQYAMAKDAYDRQVARADSISQQMAAGATKNV